MTLNLKTRTLAVLTFAVAAVTSCWGDTIPVANPSFETPATTSIVTPTDWIATGTAGSYNPYESNGGNFYFSGADAVTDPANSGSGYPGIDGENVGYAFETGPGSGLSQLLSATLQANTSYTLTVAMLTRNGSGAGPSLGSEIDLLAGSTVIASAIDTVGPAPGGFEDQIASLTDSNGLPSLIGEQLSIVLKTTNTFTAGDQAATDWDNVSLTETSAIPEPGSIFLLLGGGAIVLMLAHHKAPRSGR